MIITYNVLQVAMGVTVGLLRGHFRGLCTAYIRFNEVSLGRRAVLCEAELTGVPSDNADFKVAR